MKTIKYLGVRPLTYGQVWMVGGPYTWAKTGETCLVDPSDADRLLEMKADFVDVSTEYVCDKCGKVCVSVSGLSRHQNFCYKVEDNDD